MGTVEVEADRIVVREVQWTPRGPAFAGAVDGANAYAAALARELLGRARSKNLCQA